MTGYVYVLGNESLPEMYKIGGTQKDPEQRAKELSNTSIPTPYKVLEVRDVDNWRKSEAFIHKALDSYRVSSNREFFQCSLDEIKDQLSKLEFESKPVKYVIYGGKGGSGSSTVGFSLAEYYKKRGLTVRVNSVESRMEGLLSSNTEFETIKELGFDNEDPHVEIYICPSLYCAGVEDALVMAKEHKARVIIPTLVDKLDLNVLYSDIGSASKKGVKPYVLFNSLPYFGYVAEEMAKATITSISLGANVLPYQIPFSQEYQSSGDYSLFDVSIDALIQYFEYEGYERNEMEKEQESELLME